MRLRSPPRAELIGPGILIGMLAVYLWRLEPLLDGRHGPIGDDYTYFFPRLVGVAGWFLKNGWAATPWFTPALCGGLPAYGNPQTMAYSVPEWLTLVGDPGVAVQVTFALFALAGVSGAYVLLRASFGTSTWAATLGAGTFLCNGFFSHRMVVGHLAFHAMMLTPWIAFLLTRRERSKAQRFVDATIAGLLVAFMVQSGMIVILVPVMLAVVGLGIIHSLRWGETRQVAARLAVAGLWAMLLCANRLVAIGSFMEHFNRDFYPLPGVSRLLDLVALAMRALFWRADDSSGKVFANLNIELGQHEWQYSVSPVPLVLIVVAGVAIATGRARPVAVSRSPWLWGGLVAILLVPLAVNFHTPAWSQLLKTLPVIRSTSSVVRWMVLYVPIVPVIAALALDRLPGPPIVSPSVASLGVAGVLVFSTVIDAPDASHSRYDPGHLIAGWRSAREHGALPPIERMFAVPDSKGVLTGALQGDDLLVDGTSQVFCYEPLFGYDLSRLPRGDLHPGLALEATGDELNVKNPACDLWPSENHCQAGDAFQSARREDAEAFVSYEPFEFEMSRTQTVATWVSPAALIGAVVVLVLGAVRRSRRVAR